MQNSRVFLAFFASIIATALAVGAGVYLWQGGFFEKAQDQTKCEVSIETSSVLKQSTSDNKQKEVQQKLCTLSDSTFPIVVYKPGGLLTETDKKNLQEKLVNPFFDFYNETEVNYITMTIKIPGKMGEDFTVEAIHKIGGYQDFLFGKRGQNFDWWQPDCLGGCQFSSKFKAKYPQIVNKP